MAITIKVGKAAQEQPPKPSISGTARLKAKKTLDGRIMISDHTDIDIVIMPTESKIITFSKQF